MWRLLRDGRSLSGNERNCSFLNCGGPRFANVSAAMGLDYADDARSQALVDWDHDGDLDLWVYNRSGPRLRLMRNQTDATSNDHLFVAFRLKGTTCHRDAIGARVEVKLAGSDQRKRLVQTLYAGHGFLSQSSNWVHFGLGKRPQVEEVTVHWPGGEAERFTGVVPGKRYSLEQGSGKARQWSPPARSLKLVSAEQQALRQLIGVGSGDDRRGAPRHCQPAEHAVPLVGDRSEERFRHRGSVATTCYG